MPVLVLSSVVATALNGLAVDFLKKIVSAISHIYDSLWELTAG